MPEYLMSQHWRQTRMITAQGLIEGVYLGFNTRHRGNRVLSDRPLGFVVQSLFVPIVANI
eukprot:2455542-Amphidinium_carterae.1